jgi:hypothetical protein
MSDLHRGDTFKVAGFTAKVVEFCDEPDTGLCIVEYNGWAFKLPTVFVERLRSPDNYCCHLSGSDWGRGDD